MCCKKCSKEIPEGSVVCPFCTAPTKDNSPDTLDLNNSSPSTVTVDHQKTRKDIKRTTVLIVISVLSVLGAITRTVLSGSGNSDPSLMNTTICSTSSRFIISASELDVNVKEEIERMVEFTDFPSMWLVQTAVVYPDIVTIKLHLADNKDWPATDFERKELIQTCGNVMNFCVVPGDFIRVETNLFSASGRLLGTLTRAGEIVIQN